MSTCLSIFHIILKVFKEKSSVSLAWLAHLGVDGVELLDGDELLALLLGGAELVQHLERGVGVQAAEGVGQVEEVHAGLALKVVDVEGELGAWWGAGRYESRRVNLTFSSRFDEFV